VGRTEDQVRNSAETILGFVNSDEATSGTGQITTFNQLGFKGVSYKPDGWYLPKDKGGVAIILETKSEGTDLDTQKWVDELNQNVDVTMSQYSKVIGILYNGRTVRCFKNKTEVQAPTELQNKQFYIDLFLDEGIDKQRIYTLTARINNLLHGKFGVTNLYHRMILTACALVAERYGAKLENLKESPYQTFNTTVVTTLSTSLEDDRKQNSKIDILLDEYSTIRMNTPTDQQAIAEFIDCVVSISECINSNKWRGEDVMGIFFNEFNRYKKKSEAGQVFTPEHITDFMYRILEVNKNDRVLDAACGSGGFLVKAMSNMMQEAGGPNTEKAKEIKQTQLYGIEYYKYVYALACANMLIHKDGKTNLEWLDSRGEEAGAWIRSKNITKVLMNPPFETKFGCMQIVENVLNNVPEHTMCAFILPDKKLEKAKSVTDRIKTNHRLRKVIKLPEDLFQGTGVTTSIFVFEAGVPQDKHEFFTCWMKDDGLETVKNKGRHDVHGRWPAIENHWADVVLKQSGDDTCKWEDPGKCMSYQVPVQPFQVSEEDFRKTAMDYLMYKRGIDSREFSDRLFETVLYSSTVESDDDHIRISMDRSM
jgi:type I restriction enzyme M protein